MAIVFDSDAGTITGLSVGGLPDGIVDAGTVAADVATQAEIDAKLNLAGGTMTGTLDVGVSDTGHDVKFHGATAGCKIFWDESADKLRVEGRTDGSDIFIVTDNAADILNIKSTGVVFNEDSGDRDFRVESDGNSNALFMAGSDGNLNIGTSGRTSNEGTNCLIIQGTQSYKPFPLEIVGGTGSTSDISAQCLINLRQADGGACGIRFNKVSPNLACWLYMTTGGELQVMDDSGNTTTISPHNFTLLPNGASEEGAWNFYSRKKDDPESIDETDSTYVIVDMAKVVRDVESLTGVKHIHKGTGTTDDGSVVASGKIAELTATIEALTARVTALET